MSKEWPKEVKSGHAVVKVYRNRHHGTTTGWIHIVAFATPSGPDREKFADEAKAMEQARIKAAQLAAGHVEAARMTNSDRDELLAARKIAGEIPLLVALKEWSKARELTTGNLIPAAQAWAARNGGKSKDRLRVSQVLKLFLAAKTAAGKTVAEDHKSAFEFMDRDLGQYYIDSCPVAVLDKWLDQWPHPSTRNTRRKRLVSVWRWARKKGYLPRDAVTEAEQTDSHEEPDLVIGIILVPDLKVLLPWFAKNRRPLLASLVLASLCGLRRSEVHGQKWQDIFLDRKDPFLKVTTAKKNTPARRYVPICPAAKAWLKLCPKDEYVSPMVTWKGDRHPSLSIDGIRKAIRENQLIPSLPENCFRHAYISHKVQEIGNKHRTAEYAGNSPEEIDTYYRELVTEAEGRAWFRVGPTRRLVQSIAAEPEVGNASLAPEKAAAG